RTPGRYFDDRRLLGGDPGLSSRVCLHVYGHGPRSRSILHNLRGPESRTDGGKLSELVSRQISPAKELARFPAGRAARKRLPDAADTYFKIRSTAWRTNIQ